MLFKTPHRRRTIISLTPLIDVVFILLVFFMLSSRLTATGHVALDWQTSGQNGGEVVDVLTVTPTQLLLNQQPINWPMLAQWQENQHLLLRPTTDASLQRLLDVRARLQAQGIQANVGFPRAEGVSNAN
ncbi:MAG TPA: biopolymer transporter ExbD [Gammaproteobacteria bacterium]|nr:biopolymer transporter ExbD [Gammaproteobacteria bacterium]